MITFQTGSPRHFVITHTALVGTILHHQAQREQPLAARFHTARQTQENSQRLGRHDSTPLGKPNVPSKWLHYHLENKLSDDGPVNTVNFGRIWTAHPCIGGCKSRLGSPGVNRLDFRSALACLRKRPMPCCVHQKKARCDRKIAIKPHEHCSHPRCRRACMALPR